MTVTNERLKEMLGTNYTLTQEGAEVIKELLERREKDKPKSLKAPVSDDFLENLAANYLAHGEKPLSGTAPLTAACLRELLEYRRLTRRTHYQEGDYYVSTDQDKAFRCQILVDSPVYPHTHCLIPLSNFAHLHTD
jgi:hypothetical protein